MGIATDEGIWCDIEVEERTGGRDGYSAQHASHARWEEVLDLSVDGEAETHAETELRGDADVLVAPEREVPRRLEVQLALNGGI